MRKGFGHDADKRTGFRQRYFADLEKKEEPAAELVEKARAGPLTLVYGAKDEEHNNAAALRECLEK